MAVARDRGERTLGDSVPTEAPRQRPLAPPTPMRPLPVRVLGRGAAEPGAEPEAESRWPWPSSKRPWRTPRRVPWSR